MNPKNRKWHKYQAVKACVWTPCAIVKMIISTANYPAEPPKH